MAEEVRIGSNGNGNGRYDERVTEWEDGLPGLDDLTPLSQALIPPELLTAFRITAEQPRSLVEVNRASKKTMDSIRGELFDNFREQNTVVVVDDEDNDKDLNLGDSRKLRIIEDQNSEFNNSNFSGTNDDGGSGRSSKRPRLVWTPQLHKRFVDVVGHVGIKNAVPKSIMQLMNVEGLTRENVASHLQKYRLYLKRMEGVEDEVPSASDPLFDSTVPRGLHDAGGGGDVGESGSGRGNGHRVHHQSNGNGHFGMSIPMSYAPPPPQMMHMPYIGMAGHGHGHGHGHLGVPHGNGYHGYEGHHHQYNMMPNKFSLLPQYNHNHVAPSDN